MLPLIQAGGGGGSSFPNTASVLGGWWGFYWNEPSITSSNGGNINSNNAIKCVLFIVPVSTTVSALAVNVTNAVAGTTFDIGLYDATTGIGLFNTNGASFGGSGLSGATTGNKHASFTRVTIPAGIYLLAWTGTSSGALASFGWTIGASTNTTIQKGISTGVASTYFASSDSATAGILPSTLVLAHLTGSGGFADPPATFFGF